MPQFCVDVEQTDGYAIKLLLSGWFCIHLCLSIYFVNTATSKAPNTIFGLDFGERRDLVFFPTECHKRAVTIGCFAIIASVTCTLSVLKSKFRGDTTGN